MWQSGKVWLYSSGGDPPLNQSAPSLASAPGSEGERALAVSTDDLATSLPLTENKRFYPALDGLRAVAVLMVFFQHYLAPIFPTLNWGWAGVDIFFVLSGFLITGILYDSREATNRFRVFYMRRTLRIFPLYYGVLLVALLTTPIMHWLWNPAWYLWFFYLGNYARFVFLNSPLLHTGAIEHLVSQRHDHFGLIYALGHFWSLCVEEQFYLVWPLIVFSVRRRETLRAICLWSLPLVLGARILCVWTLPQAYLSAEFLYRVTPLRADALLLGGFVALCLRGPEAARLIRLANPVFYSLLASFALFELSFRRLSHTGRVFVPYAGAPVLTTIGYTLIDLFAAALIVKILTIDNPLARFLNAAPLRSLGKVSYGFYVFHDVFHWFCFGVVRLLLHGIHSVYSDCLVALLALVLTISLSYLSFHFYETPFLRLKSRYLSH